MNDGQAHWEQVYSTRPAETLSWFQVAPEPSLDAILALAPTKETPIIDVGGGASGLVDALIDRGFADVSVLDISAAALAQAQGRLGAAAAQVRWKVADVTRWTPARVYRIWHDRAVFHFLTEPEQRAAYSRALEVGLAPGGFAIIGTFAREGPERCSGLPVSRYDADRLAAELGPEFRLVRDWRETHRTPGDTKQLFQWCVLRRR